MTSGKQAAATFTAVPSTRQRNSVTISPVNITESDVLELLEERLSDACFEHVDDFVDQLILATGAFYHSSTNRAAMAVFNHATNDVLDLINDCFDGRGRTAARTARALFEHAVNIHVVSTSGDMADRYQAHRVVTENILSTRRPGLDRLPPGRARARRQAFDRMGRRSRAGLRDAALRFGPRFRKDWAPRNLRERAEEHGLGADYDAYRVLSTVVHGTPGGLTGTRATIRGEAVHRSGPNLEMASLAWLEGLTFFRHFVRALPLTSDQDVEPLLATTETLLKDWPALDHALLAIDSDLWPEAAPARDVALLAFYPTRERWYFYHTATEQIALAEPPRDAAEKVGEARRAASDRIRAHNPDNCEGRPFTLVMWDVNVSPKREGTGWHAAQSVLIPGSFPAVLIRGHVVDAEQHMHLRPLRLPVVRRRQPPDVRGTADDAPHSGTDH